jgi:hypothetical protein
MGITVYEEDKYKLHESLQKAMKFSEMRLQFCMIITDRTLGSYTKLA